MRIGFHSNQLGVRGTEVALYDYAKYNREILGNESVILYPSESPGNDINAVFKFSKYFPVYGYQDHKNINSICDTENLDAMYYIKSGRNDGKTSNRKNLIHAVFQEYDPHGDKYAYISEWLANYIEGIVLNKTDYVPFIVDLPLPTGDMRETLNIPKNALVIGRYGGPEQFDIPFVKTAIEKYLIKNPNSYFVFVNTFKFHEHPRIIYLNPIVDLQEKSNFINTCDAMIHARAMGESFGLAICEFLFHNKPVFAWYGGSDKHHVQILQNSGLLYNDESDVLSKFDMLADGEFCNMNCKQLVDKFSPKNVMTQFNKVFLENLL